MSNILLVKIEVRLLLKCGAIISTIYIYIKKKKKKNEGVGLELVSFFYYLNCFREIYFDSKLISLDHEIWYINFYFTLAFKMMFLPSYFLYLIEYLQLLVRLAVGTCICYKVVWLIILKSIR